MKSIEGSTAIPYKDPLLYEDIGNQSKAIGM